MDVMFVFGLRGASRRSCVSGIAVALTRCPGDRVLLCDLRASRFLAFPRNYRIKPGAVGTAGRTVGGWAASADMQTGKMEEGGGCLH